MESPRTSYSANAWPAATGRVLRRKQNQFFFLGGKIQKMELNKTQGHGLHCAFYSFCIIFSFIFLSLREEPQLATVYVMLSSSQKDVMDYK